MILVSIGIAVLVSFGLLIESALLIWIHLKFSLKTQIFQLLYNDLTIRKKKDSCDRSLNWSYYINNLFVLMLLIIIMLFMKLIVENISQPLVTTLYLESIFLIILVIMMGTFIIFFPIHQKFQKICSSNQIQLECELMNESSQRAQQNLTSFSEDDFITNDQSSPTTTTTTTTQCRQDHLITSSFAQKTFDMF